MRPRPVARPALCALALLVAALGCTDSELYQPYVHNKPALDRAVQVKGNFCTDSANDVIRPVKVIIAMDTSLSMNVTDPNGTRATALVDLLNSFPQDDPEIFVGVLLFAGFTPVWFTHGGLSGFDQLMSLSPTDREVLKDKILAYGYPNGQPNRGATDFVKPLDEIYATISRDLSESAQAQTADGGTYEPVRSQYSVIFLSDGAPSFDQDDEIHSRVQAIRSLKDQAGDCKLNTVHVFDPLSPPSPICAPGNDAGCPSEIIQGDVDRLSWMADEGGGEFRDFQNHEPVNFLSFRLGATKRRFVIGRLTLFNLSAKPHSNIEDADTDNDGLTDREEAALGTDPLKADTDGDGFSDGVEVYFRKLGGSFDPLGGGPDGGGDLGCLDSLKGVDSDGDGILDCDEQLLGSNSNGVDTDGDGVPDLVEWLGGTQLAAQDMDADPDGDGLHNEEELRMHTDPQSADSGDLAQVAYRYKLVRLPIDRGDGSTCYDFEVDNVQLVPTLDQGAGPGLNNLLLSISVVPEDDANASPITHLAHLTAGYPTHGIKTPPDGVLPVTQDDFARYLH